MKVVPVGALRLDELVRSGDHVLWGEGAGEPATLVARLLEQSVAIGSFTAFVGFGSSRAVTANAPVSIGFRSYGALGTTRALAKAGRLEILPEHIGMLPLLIDSGHLRCDVALIHVSAAGPDGRHSLGASVMHMESAISRARVVIAEINDHMPYTFGHRTIGPEDVDFAIETSAPLPEESAPRLSPTDQAIARHVCMHIDDGATLQAGIGGVPDAVAAALGDRRDLGVHSGMIGDGLAALIAAGVVTNARKPIDRGISVGGILVGREPLFRLAERNPALHVRPSSYTHNPRVLGRIDNLVSINSALEIDLTGQVGAETVGGAAIGAIGGQADFLRAAHRAPKGCAIVALPSAGKAGSRIRERLSGPVSTARSDVDVVVTEHGSADLRGLSETERRRAILAIADPHHRGALEAASREIST